MSVRLCMLARDEAHRIERVAEAVGDLVDDYVVLVDSRSSDSTEEQVEYWLGGAGRVLEFRFVDFAQARNELFYCARAGLEHDDYLLLVDPDSPPRGTLPELGADAYSCTWRMGSNEWHLPILVRVGVDCAYEGAVHELLVGVDPVWTPTLRVEVEPKPNDPARSEAYVELLERDAATSPRSAFYLARTLRDLGRRGAAVEWYLRAAQMGDSAWVEETYICLLDAGVLLLPLDVELARVLLERAARYRPGRLETSYWLAWLANWEGRHEDALAIALNAALEPRSTDTLFVNRWAERDGLVEEMNRARAALAVAAPIMEAAHGESLR